jgi:hypothetical protein
MAAIYCADMWCDDCADAIRKRLQWQEHAPPDPNDERSYDSDEYPKHADDDEESDTPQHCAAGEECLNAVELPSGHKVGVLFGVLTSDGVDYVRQYALEEGSSEVVKLWVQYFSDHRGYDLELTECPHCGGFVDAS